MQTVLLVVHLMIAAALVAVVLVQRSEGGALGIGGGGGGFMSGRGAANAMTRLTAYLAAAFFASSIALTLIANQTIAARSVFDAPAASTTAPATPGTTPPAGPPAGQTAPRGGVLDKLQIPGQGQAPVTPRAPQGQ
jgi:preprotein translocase subunit SecG